MDAEQCPVDLSNRDPNDQNTHVGVKFEDVFGEPDSFHSIDCVWVNSYKCFTCTKNCCYKLLTVLCGIFIAFCWGCEFAIIAFQHIWYIGPCFKVCSINLGCAQKFFGSAVQCCLAPICEAMGMFFSNIKVENK